MVAVGGVDPLESRVVVVPHGGLVGVDLVELRHEVLHARVTLLVEQPPVQGVGLVPLLLLAELLAHEQQLLAGVGPLVGVQGAQARELLPLVAGHLVDEGALAVDHLVVGQRQDEVLREGVHQRECQLPVVPTSVHRILTHVAQGVVHPAHVPLQAEAQAATAGRCRHAGPRRGLLGDHDDPRVVAVGGGVGLLDELDRLQVLAPAVLVGAPLTVLARVVEVEHRGHRVHAQAVDVEVLQPVQGVGHQEVADLAAPEVEDVRPPVGVLPPQGVRVLVQGRAVETGQRPVVLREVGGHPVEDHADPRLVEAVHQVPEVVGCAVPRRGGVVGGDLVAPGTPEGVLGHRHELHVREARLLEVGDQLVGEAPVSQALLPGTHVDLVDRHGPLVRGTGGTRVHPFLVLPVVEVVGDDRGGGRRDLRGPRQRIGLLEPVATRALDLVLVAGAHTDAGDEDLPHAGGPEGTHRGGGAVPEVEVTDDPHGARAGGPHGEGDTLDVPHLPGVVLEVRAEHLPQFLVTTLLDEVGVHLPQGRQEAVRVVDDGDLVAVGDAHPVVGDLREGKDRHPDPVAFVRGGVGGVLGDDLDRVGEVVHGPHGDGVVPQVGPEHGVGIEVVAVGDGIEGGGVHWDGCRFHVPILPFPGPDRWDSDGSEPSHPRIARPPRAGSPHGGGSPRDGAAAQREVRASASRADRGIPIQDGRRRCS